MPDVVAGRQGLGSLPNNGVEVWRGLGGGAFALAPPALGAGLPGQWIGGPEGIAIGDLNDDTFPEVGVAAYGMGVEVLVNEMSGFSRYGEGCAGALPSAPAIANIGSPTLGNAAFGWGLASGIPGGIAILVLGTSKTYFLGQPVLPLSLAPLGAPGCSLLASPDVFVGVVAGPGGTAVVTTPIPNNPSFLLATVFGQWGVVAPGANGLGLVVSRGGAARIGP